MLDAQSAQPKRELGREVIHGISHEYWLVVRLNLLRQCAPLVSHAAHDMAQFGQGDAPSPTPHRTSLGHTGFQAGGADRVSDGMHTHLNAFAQCDTFLEVNLPALMHLRRLMGPYPLRLDPTPTSETFPLVQITTDTGHAGDAHPAQRRPSLHMAAQVARSPARMFQPQAQNNVTHLRRKGAQRPLARTMIMGLYAPVVPLSTTPFAYRLIRISSLICNLLITPALKMSHIELSAQRRLFRHLAPPSLLPSVQVCQQLFLPTQVRFQ